MTIGDGLPESASRASGEPTRTVSADVLRGLLTGGINEPARKFRLQGARIAGKLDLTGAALVVPIDFQDCSFDEPVTLVGLTVPSVNLRGCHLPSLEASRLKTRDLDASDGFNAKSVRLDQADVSGSVMFDDATLHNPGKVAFFGRALNVGQFLSLGNGFTAHGKVDLVGATVGKSLVFTGATLNHPGEFALDAQGVSVGFAVFLGSSISNPLGFTALGGIRLIDARIDQFLCCWQGRIENPGGYAIAAQGMNIRQTLLMQNGFSAVGTIDLNESAIGGSFHLSNADLDGGDGCALTAERMECGASLKLAEKVVVRGSVTLDAAIIVDRLELVDADLSGCPSLNLAYLRARSLVFSPSCPPSEMDLRHAAVAVLADDIDCWPKEYSLQDFSYDQLGRGSDPSASRRIEWLRRNKEGYLPHPYEQLIAVYRRRGDERAVRRVSVAKMRHQRTALNWAGKAWNLLLQVAVGYGYRTWQAGIWLLLLVILGGHAFSVADGTEIVAIKQPAPSFNPYAYAAEVSIPVLNLGLRSSWAARGSAAYWCWGLTAGGWILTTAVVAGIARLVKRD
ncbi:hypothetical protein [Actinoplanes sp. ATCC 53533]|uniref:hypothetical protein n=1 Tax=Actinoplanes sp. ATCC 53533 TaxID=1288362 RepID=UPI000F7BAB24|nr:hypothetical protein [Actinoplanes sp. ATCC 53533]